MEDKFRLQFLETINQILSKSKLDTDSISETFKNLLDHKLKKANETCMGAFLGMLQMYPLSRKNLLSLIKVVLEYDRKEIHYKDSDNLCGIVGSGKDQLKTFNISTAAAFVAAGAGVRVVKNGSRSDSSIAGTTDVLESLGIKIDLNAAQTIELLEKYGITICDAGNYFPRMSKEYVGKVMFVNPLSFTLSIASGLKFKKILFGISFNKTRLVASLLKDLGMKKFMVAYGTDSKGRGFDEISSIGKTYVSELSDNKIIDYVIEPSQFGFTIGSYEEIAQKESVKKNADFLFSILNNQIKTSARDIVLLNAGALIYISGLTNDLRNGIELAKNSLESGRAIYLINSLISHKYERQ